MTTAHDTLIPNREHAGWRLWIRWVWTLNWIVVFVVAVVVGYAVQTLFHLDFASGLALDSGIGGAVSGALTGGVLLWLLRQPGRTEMLL